MSQSLPDQEPRESSVESQATAQVDRIERAGIDQRRTTESIVLVLIALIGVWWLRSAFESSGWLIAELITVLALALLALLPRGKHGRWLIAGMLAAPPLFAFLARQTGYPNPFELTALATMGAGALCLALFSRTNRNRAMSVVASGFLILFTTVINDHPGAVIPALIWIAVCLWHLVANHWERVGECTPDKVRRSIHVRPLTVILGVGLFIVGGWSLRGRLGDPDHFSWGIMPTSGGSSWSDPAARSGVGSGDKAIAAKNHAESFGAVESDMFLESTQSTLYDMFSDSIGQPKLKQKWERRQGLSPEMLIHAHQRTARTEQGSASFSTSRDKPPKPTPLRDATERAVVQWIGPTGIRLAMNRYDTFDGVEWSQESNLQKGKLSRVDIEEEVWFFNPPSSRQTFKSRHSGILKAMRLDATHIPAPMMTVGVHIKDVDRQDFFGVDRDGSLFMPGREQIPTLTVFHLASMSVMEDELLKSDALAVARPAAAASGKTEQNRVAATSEGQALAAELAQQLIGSETNPYQQLKLIVNYLRDEFIFDRQSSSDASDPLLDFLQRRRGGDHMFATAAAEMARDVGLNSRLVSGFYVRPGAVDVGQGHASVVPEDVHVWAEVQLKDGRWIELEPTPGYREPRYTPSLWLQAKRWTARHWPHLLGLATLVTLIYLTRVAWFELLMWLAWSVGRQTSGRYRVRVLLWILQTRAWFAGKPRQHGLPQRDWLLSLTVNDKQLTAGAVACCNAADRMIFGQQAVRDDWSRPANLIARKVTTKYISRRNIAEKSTIGVTA